MERQENTTDGFHSGQELIGGFDFHFIDSIPDRLICQICLKVLKDPQLMICCGKKFCISCLRKSFKMNNSESCPHCRHEKGDSLLHVLEKELKSEIESCKVQCLNFHLGCKWEGEIRNLDGHLKAKHGCGYVKLKCTNYCTSDNGVLQVFYRKDMQEHVEFHCELRKVNCKYCDHAGIAKSFKDHELSCTMFPVECPNKCGAKSLPRHTVRNHRDICPNEPIQCPNNCGTLEIVRCNLAAHRHSCMLEPTTCPNHCGETGIIRQYLHVHRLHCCNEPIECPNGCQESGINRKTLASHIKVCPFEFVKCKYADFGCSDRIQRLEVEHHEANVCRFRVVRCRYCIYQGTAASLVQHLKVCEMVPVECPNMGCGQKRIIRQLLDGHRLECEYEVIDCGFAHVGCLERVMRMSMPCHERENQAKHLELMCEAFKNVSQELQEETERRESDVKHMLRAQKYRQQLIEKDILLQKALGDLKELKEKFENESMTVSMKTRDYDNLKITMHHREKVIRKEMELFKANYEDKSPQYSYVVNSKSQHPPPPPPPAASSTRPESLIYSHVKESRSGCACETYRKKCLQSFKSIEAQINEPHSLSQERLLLRMVDFDKISSKSMMWTSPSFTLNNKLLMELNVRLEKQSFMNLKIKVKEAHESCDRECLTGITIKVELVPVEEMVAPMGDAGYEDDNRIVTDIDAADLFGAKDRILTVIKHSVRGWEKSFVIRDSILWAVTTDCVTNRRTGSHS